MSFNLKIIELFLTKQILINKLTFEKFKVPGDFESFWVGKV